MSLVIPMNFNSPTLPSRPFRTKDDTAIAEIAEDAYPIQPIEEMLNLPLPLWKRGLDVIASAGALVLLAPLMALTALAIWITAGRPIFFLHERTGHNMRRFRVIKFRTMINGASGRVNEVRHLNEMTGPLIKIRDDPRLIRVGRLLRRTSIDELPQLINVLRGEMTLIGPRALSPRPEMYAPWQRRRFSVVPGCACTWQAERRHERDFSDWVRSDLHYIDRASFRTDLRLIFKVIRQVFQCNGD